MANQIERDVYVTHEPLKNPISYVRGTDAIPIVFHFRDYDIPSGASVSVFVAKPSGKAVYNSATISGNDVTVTVDSQMFMELGTSEMQVSISQGGKELVQFAQPVNVKANLKAGDFPDSSTSSSFLDDMIAQAQEAVNNANIAAQQAQTAVQNANLAVSNANDAVDSVNAMISSMGVNFSSLAQSTNITQLQTTSKNLVGAINELNSKKTQGDAKIVGLTNISSIKITNISSLYGSILITTNKDGYNNNPICALIYLNGKDNYGAIFITGNQDEMTVSYEEAELNINFNARIHGSVILGGSISAGTEINTIY